MKNRIGYLLVAAGVSIGAATLAFSAPAATAAECNIKAIENACETIDFASCAVAVLSTCTSSSCGVAVASDCDDCVVGVASDCAPEPTPTATPTAVQKVLDAIKRGGS